MLLLNPRGSGASFAPRFVLMTGLFAGLSLNSLSLAQAAMQENPAAEPKFANPGKSEPSAAAGTVADAAVQTVEIGHAVKTETHDDYTNSRSYDRRYLDQFGDTNAADLLSRLPAISVVDNGSKGMTVRLRGAGNGYTQILVDGQPLPQGFTIDQIPASQIERIEVLRTPGVELNQQAPAGAINVIMKPKIRSAHGEFRWNQSFNQSRWNHQLTGQWSDQVGAFGYMLGMQLDSQTEDKLDQSVQQARSSIPLQTVDVTETQQLHRQSLNLQQRLQYRNQQIGQLSWQSWMQFQRPLMARQGNESGQIPPGDFVLSADEFTARTRSWRQELNWDATETEYGKLNVTLGWNWLNRDSEFWFTGRDASTALQEQRWVSGSVQDNQWRLALQWRWGNDRIQWKTGWEWKPGKRAETRDETVREVSGSSPPEDLRRFETDSRNHAWYLQQEWQIRPDWNWSLGIRAEWLDGSVAATDSATVHQQALTWSPVWQQVWKATDRYQWRLSVNQTWKLPDAFQLTPRPYRIDNNNTPVNPDQQGNPALLPERARGLELALESAGNDQQGWNIGMFWRRLHQRIADDLSFSNGRWLATPMNSGDADWYGVEAELHGQTAASQYAQLPARLNWKASGFYNYSKVTSLNGPDNHIPEQLPWGVTLQADLQLNEQSRIGLSVSRNASERYQANRWLWLTQSHRWQIDSYLNWQMSSHDSLRIAVNDWLARADSSFSQLNTGQQSWNEQRHSCNARTLRISWESRW